MTLAQLSPLSSPESVTQEILPLACHHGMDADAYRHLARRWAGSVTVVTTRGTRAEHGVSFDGVTATTFLTISINPPIVLVSIARSTYAAFTLLAAKSFVVNLLAENQAGLSRCFARPQAERALIPWDRVSTQRDWRGIPVLNGTVGAFSAELREAIDAGDHLIILGDVKQIWLGGERRPLLYSDRTYARLDVDLLLARKPTTTMSTDGRVKSWRDR